MILPVPARYSGSMYTECEVVAPSVDDLANTTQAIKSGKYFQAMRPYLVGVIKSITTRDGALVNDPISIKAIIPKIPYKSVEAIISESIVLHHDGDDGIEGIYPCPRCGHQIVAEKREDEEGSIDTTDKISDLKISYFDLDVDSFEIHVELTEPVIVTDKRSNEVVQQINGFDVEIPTLENHINAESKHPSNDPVRLQIAIYLEALKAVNGEIAGNKWKGEWGMYMFGNIRTVRKDLGYLADHINRFGIDQTVKKTCPRCGKSWKATVQTSNFFGPGLLEL